MICSASRAQYVVRRLVGSRAWNGTRVLTKVGPYDKTRVSCHIKIHVVERGKKSNLPCQVAHTRRR